MQIFISPIVAVHPARPRSCASARQADAIVTIISDSVGSRIVSGVYGKMPAVETRLTPMPKSNYFAIAETLAEKLCEIMIWRRQGIADFPDKDRCTNLQPDSLLLAHRRQCTQRLNHDTAEASNQREPTQALLHDDASGRLHYPARGLLAQLAP